MKRLWELTETSFNRLLLTLDPDRDQAGAAYEMLHRKLVRFFEWKQCPNPHELSDETVNRVARKLDEGHTLTGNPGDFFFGVARFVLKEHWKVRNPVELDPEIEATTVEDDGTERAQLCLDQCLASLFQNERDLVLRFYHFDGREKIEDRQKLADEMRIPMNALRIRVHRIRARLKSCVQSCLDGEMNFGSMPVQVEGS